MHKNLADELLWIIIPAHNETAEISDCLLGFSLQVDKHFRLILVDNASTDDTVKIAKQAASEHDLLLTIITEHHKGTGWACRAGFQYAIDNGAKLLARTDSDCTPDRKWVLELRRYFKEGYEFIGGKLKPKKNENFLAKMKLSIAWFIVRVAVYARRLSEKGDKDRFMMSPGANLAVTADLYTKIGGFTESSIETLHEDLDLSNRARAGSKKTTETKRAVVYTSTRRINALGLRGTLLWYDKQVGRSDIR